MNYWLFMTDGSGNAVSHAGGLVALAALAIRWNARLGMTGSLLRPDGTRVLVHRAKRLPLPR